MMEDASLILPHALATAADEGFVPVENPVGRRWGDGHFFLVLTYEFTGSGGACVLYVR